MLGFPTPAASRSHLGRLLAWALCAGALACDGASTPPTNVDAAETIFVNCSGCHDGSTPLSGVLDLRWPEQDVAQLVGKPAAGMACGPSGAILVKPDGSGVFLDKLRAMPSCGDRMPQGTFPLTPAEIDGIARWLADLAARTGQ